MRPFLPNSVIAPVRPSHVSGGGEGFISASATLGGGRPEQEEGALIAGLKEEVVEGLRWVWGQPLLRSIMVIAAVMNIVFFATFSIRVLFATEILGLDATGFGLLMAADGGGSSWARSQRRA